MSVMMAGKRELYCHEDDYCQQQLLPGEAGGFVEIELKRAAEFAEAHRDPGGAGWTDMYVVGNGPAEFRALEFPREAFAAIVEQFLPSYAVVYSGYGTQRELRAKTAGWGRSAHCALFAEWDDRGIITNAWTSFLERDAGSIAASGKAVAAIASVRQVLYVDWAWGYMCDARDEDRFTSMLRVKLDTIAGSSRSQA